MSMTQIETTPKVDEESGKKKQTKQKLQEKKNKRIYTNTHKDNQFECCDKKACRKFLR